jgi:hypothetical protein
MARMKGGSRALAMNIMIFCLVVSMIAMFDYYNTNDVRLRYYSYWIFLIFGYIAFAINFFEPAGGSFD